jgi:hypothetical protein
MSWWKTSQGIIGDKPADILGDTLDAIMRMRQQKGQGKPTLQEMADDILAGLRMRPDVYVEDGGRPAIRAIVIKVEGQPDVMASGADAAIRQDTASEALADSFKAIVRVYQAELDRKPTLRELLDNVLFVLGGRTETYVSTDGPNDVFLNAIVPVPQEALQPVGR